MPARKLRESELQRPRSRKGGGAKNASKGVAYGGQWYQPNADWSLEIKQLWNAAKRSGGAAFYEQSDVALLYMILDDLNRARSGGRLSGQLLQTLYSQLNKFLLTEADRRAANIELEAEVEEEDEPAEVVQMREYEKGLGLVK